MSKESWPNRQGSLCISESLSINKLLSTLALHHSIRQISQTEKSLQFAFEVYADHIDSDRQLARCRLTWMAYTLTWFLQKTKCTTNTTCAVFCVNVPRNRLISFLAPLLARCGEGWLKRTGIHWRIPEHQCCMTAPDLKINLHEKLFPLCKAILPADQSTLQKFMKVTFASNVSTCIV